MSRERKNIRLKDWDYSSEGIYFLTVCCRERKSFFGKIDNNKMHLSDIGSIASQFWMVTPNHFLHVRLDEFVVMPNHLHGIIILDYSLVGPRHGVALQSLVFVTHYSHLYKSLIFNYNLFNLDAATRFL